MVRAFTVCWVAVGLIVLSAAGFGAPGDYFRVTIVDEATSRGVPAVRVQLTNLAEYWTDSAGVAAICEPDLWGQRVFVSLATHGYESPREPFMKYEGAYLELEPGASATIAMRRKNVAQRLYRMTGSGIYRDSLMLGDNVPAVFEKDLPPVMGQDGGDAVVYRNKLYWFWGDSGVPHFPLGVFKSVAATSELPGNGGLDIELGVKYKYVRNDRGGLRGIFELPGNMYWYSMPRVVVDSTGSERLLSDYAKIEGYLNAVEHGLVEWDDKRAIFDLITTYPVKSVIPIGRPLGPPFRHTENGREYWYEPAPYPCIRRPATFEAETDYSLREAFTCLKDGSVFDGSREQLDRDASGKLRWGWKRNTSPVAEKHMDQLTSSGAMRKDERWYSAQDIDSTGTIESHNGTIYYNPYRKRWICLRLEFHGTSNVGEVWYLEGDTPLGPWVFARKIVTHTWKGHEYAFYGVAQLPVFDKKDGREIFFKGSFSAEFGDAAAAIPRHNYNMFLYKLDMDDPRLFLPVPVYRVGERYGTKEAFDENVRERELVWYAPDRPMEGTVPVYQVFDKDGSVTLTLSKPPVLETGRLTIEAKPVFYAVPADADVQSTFSLSRTVAVHPSFRAWKAPIEFNPYRVQ